MRRGSIVKVIGCVAAVFAFSGTPGAAQMDRRDAHGFIAASPESLLLEGATNQVLVMGDPSKAGMYVVRIRFAPGRGSRPHVHDQDRYVTVIKGTWWVHLGPESDVYDPAKMTPIKAGGFVFHPAGGHHYDMAKDEEAIVQIIGMGPVKSTQLEPASGRGQGAR
jgi:quercetin dioxygenase-like cupin family protein